jgi:hypothetical protein
MSCERRIDRRLRSFCLMMAMVLGSRGTTIAMVLLMAGAVAGCAAPRSATQRQPATTSAASANATLPADATPTPAPPSLSPTATPDHTPETPRFWMVEAGAGDDDHQGATYLSVSVTAARLGALSIQTDPAASCVVSGAYPSGTRIATSGLGQKSADPSGTVRWSYFATTSETGVGSYKLSCSKGPSVRTVTISFVIP